MLELTSCLHTASRVRMIGLAIAAIIGLAVLAPSSAHASGCTNSWTNTKGGNWFVPGNWSKGVVPTSKTEACITANGTSPYTVEITPFLNEKGEWVGTNSVNLKSLTVGGTSGTQTLVVATNCSYGEAFLSTTTGITTGTNGAITTNACESIPNVTLQGNLTNSGTLAINTNTSYNGASALLTNKGAINLAEGKELKVSNEGSVTNASGIISGGETGALVQTGGTFTEGAGWTAGSKPVIVDDATLAYTGLGLSAIALRGASKLSGNLASGQLLSIESACEPAENAVATAAGTGLTNEGSITLTNADACAYEATLNIPSPGTLSNDGTITTEPASGGSRTIEGNVWNEATGKLVINANTAYNKSGATLTNEGAINIANGVTLSALNEETISNETGGTIAGTGTGKLVQTTGTFNEGAGTTSGSKSPILDDLALNYTGKGASTIALRGASKLSGNLASGQLLSIESACEPAENAVATAAGSFLNSGTITLTNADTCAYEATLKLSEGTLSNDGTITTEPASGGSRTIEGNLTNTGTGKLVINANTAYNKTGATLTNEGAINIANGVTLSALNEETISNETGGTIAGTGTGQLVQTTGTFNQGLGKTTGTVILDDLALHYTGSGASAIKLRGSSTLSGNLASGQLLSIESTCEPAANAVATAAGSFLNSGTINLTNAETCPYNVTLNLAGGTLENKGTINSLSPHGGSRTIEGNLKNEKTVSLSAGETLNVTGSYTQGAEATLNVEIAGSGDFGALSAGGPATLAGTLAITQIEPFVGKAGETFAILASSLRTGVFSNVTGGTINKTTLSYKPTYTATGVTLEVTPASNTPTVVTGAASAVTQTSATLNATVNPNGGEVSECKFEYGTTTSYGSSAPCTPSPGSGESPVAVSASVTGLSANTTYHVRISATNSGGTSEGSDETFKTLPAASPPTVTNVNPTSGPAAGGTSVSITGTNFTGATAVTFGSTGATSFKVNSATSITAISPAETAGTVDVTVTTPGGTSAISLADRFSYLAPPTVTKLKLNKGPTTGGTTVTITGANLTGATAVKFGSTAATSFKVNSATSITAVSPAETAGTVDVTVTTPGGISAISTADHFKFVPTVTGLSPNTGTKAGGTSVTVSGAGFALGKSLTTFKFGSTKATSVNCTSTTMCTVLSPAHVVGTVDVKATVNKASSGKNTPADRFTYN